MPKETTYQRNKRLLQEVSQQLREVCVNPNSLKSSTIIFLQKQKQGIEDCVMFGSITNEDVSPRMEGLMGALINPDTYNRDPRS